MKIEGIALSGKGAAKVEIPALAGVFYEFKPIDGGERVVADVQPQHVRFFLAFPRLYRAIGDDGKTIRVRRPKVEDGQNFGPPVVVPNHVDIKRGDVGDNEDTRISAVPVDELKNVDLVAWASRRRIAWRNKRSISDYAMSRLRLLIPTNTEESVFQLLRKVVQAERSTG